MCCSCFTVLFFSSIFIFFTISCPFYSISDLFSLSLPTTPHHLSSCPHFSLFHLCTPFLVLNLSFHLIHSPAQILSFFSSSGQWGSGHSTGAAGGRALMCFSVIDSSGDVLLPRHREQEREMGREGGTKGSSFMRGTFRVIPAALNQRVDWTSCYTDTMQNARIIQL